MAFTHNNQQRMDLPDTQEILTEDESQAYSPKDVSPAQFQVWAKLLFIPDRKISVGKLIDHFKTII